MKKIAIFLVITLMAVAANAAPKKAAKPSNPNSSPTIVTVKEIIINPRQPAFHAGKTAIGTALNFPILKYGFNDDFVGSIGLSYSSGAGTSALAYLLKGDYMLGKVGEIQPSAGIFYASNGAAAATTILGLSYGLSTMIQSNLSVGADFSVLTSTTAAGASTTTILNGVTFSLAYYL